MDAALPAFYNFIETIHLFIPLLAIFACIVIFVCSAGIVGKSAQPPADYLDQISRGKVVLKAKVKPAKGSKTLVKSRSSLDDIVGDSLQKSTEKKRNEAALLSAAEKDKKRAKKSAKTEESDEWVTVVHGKQKKKLATESSSPQKTINNNNIVATKVQKKPIEIEAQAEKAQNQATEITTGTPTFQSMGDESSGEIGGIPEKDSRYVKKAVVKRKESEKRVATTPENKPEAKPRQDEFIKVEPRKRKTVRRD